MEKLHQMKECLVSVVEEQIYGDLNQISAEELGEVVDMIKDLSEAIYYCTITEAMEKNEKEDMEKMKETMYYPRSSMYSTYPVEYFDPRHRETMYAPTNAGNSYSSSGSMYSDKIHYPNSTTHVYRDGSMKDPYEGKSGEYRKMYMEGKGVKDKTRQMQELDHYMQELAQDVTEMIQDASPEEKTLLQQKLSTLITKIK